MTRKQLAAGYSGTGDGYGGQMAVLGGPRDGALATQPQLLTVVQCRSHELHGGTVEVR